MSFYDDLDPFFQPPFVKTAIYQEREIAVLFNREGIPVELGIEGRDFVLEVKTSDFPDVRHHEKITIDGQTYEVIGVNPVDDGLLTELTLKESWTISDFKFFRLFKLN